MKVADKKELFTTMLNESRKLEEVNSDFLGKIVDMEDKIEALPERGAGKDTLKKQKTEFKVSFCGFSQKTDKSISKKLI